VKERPILFSGEMVNAILSGRKSQTRRVVRLLPAWEKTGLTHDDLSKAGWWKSSDGWQYGDELVRCPYGVPGDRLWVRETFMPDGADVRYGMMKRGEITPAIRYRATEPELGKIWKWHPAIHMPRFASRPHDRAPLRLPLRMLAPQVLLPAHALGRERTVVEEADLRGLPGLRRRVPLRLATMRAGRKIRRPVEKPDP
jgi:hypothetical protein